MSKIAYEVVAVEVDKMYPPHYVLKADETVDDHLVFVETFIKSCGWDVEEFMEEFNHQTLLLIKKNNAKLN